MQPIKATRPTAEDPVPPIEMQSCPGCGKKTNVRRLTNPRAYFCTGCDLEFGHEGKKPRGDTNGRPNKYVVTVKVEQTQVDKIIELWQARVYLGDIAETVKMDPDDVAIIIIDLGRGDKIEKRPGAVFGNLGVTI